MIPQNIVTTPIGPEDPSFPGIIQDTKTIAGKQTNFVFYEYADRWVVNITQFGKLGSMLEATVEKTKDYDHTSKEPCFDVTILAGDREELWQQVLARQLLSTLSEKDGVALGLGTKPLLLSFGIKDLDDMLVRSIILNCREILKLPANAAPVLEKIK